MSQPSQDPRHPWKRLTAAARTVANDGDVSAPFGFSTRVAAIAFAQEQRAVSLFERFALRAVGLAALLALASVALNYPVLTSGTSGSTIALAEDTDVILPADDAVALVLDIGG